MKWAMFMVLLFLCGAAQAAGISGRAKAWDGDTLYMHGRSVRLWGIDAVELKQTCTHQRKRVACGAMARDALAALIDGRDVACTAMGRSYGRIVARCRVGGVDVAQALARSGMVFDVPHFSHGYYMDDARQARADGLGVWAMAVQAPALWRAAHKTCKGADCAE